MLLFAALYAATAVPLFLVLHTGHAPVLTPGQAVYVWQRAWTPKVSAAVARATPSLDVFMVLAGEIEASSAAIVPRVLGPDWRAFERDSSELWSVLRAHQLPELETEAGLHNATQALASLVQQSLAQAARADLLLAGVQLDYDCPTEDVGHYAALVQAVREVLPQTRLSITALPDWLRQPEFARLVATLDHFVLQVHSLALPTHVNAPVTLCDTGRIPAWLEAASGVGIPYYIALPTYGYELYFNEEGAFSGLAAEGAPAVNAATTRLVHADPAAMAGVVRGLSAAPPPNCLGIVWFRLPVEGDSLNWDWATLAGVMQGKAPAPRLATEIRAPKEHLYEVWIQNESGYPLTQPIAIPVDWNGGELQAYDAIGGFRATRDADAPRLRLTGAAPSPGDKIMAAWLRVIPRDTEIVSVKAAAVEVLP